jgi:hypothetical protein
MDTVPLGLAMLSNALLIYQTASSPQSPQTW